MQKRNRQSIRNRLYRILFISVFFLMLNHMGHAQSYAMGADLSFMKQAEDNGYEFKENGKVKPGMQIFKNHGYNWIRLRLFHTPTELPNDIDYTIAMARSAKEYGIKFLLDFHYSDTWADPQKQFVPKAWEGLSADVMNDSIYEYTKRALLKFKSAGVYPEMVQVGNEVTNGTLWPLGKLPNNWDNFAGFLQAAIRGVHASAEKDISPKIMIHTTKAGDWSATKDFYDRINDYGLRFDIIGMSWYPWNHGTLLDVRNCFYHTAKTYKKDIILVETGYFWKAGKFEKKPAPYPETPEGQMEFFEELNRIVLNVPNNRGAGLFWWEPAVGKSHLAARGFFDDRGNVLPVITVFDRYSRY